ncbi:MAG: diguanylate cyclase [Alphaproteobacteria bacterium]
MTSMTNVVVAGGDADAAIARIEKLTPAGYAGLAVSNGLDVFEYVVNRQPDLVLFEGAFSDVDAFEVVRKLKRSIDTLHIPAIMLNADTTPEMLQEGLESGLGDMIARDTPTDIVTARLQPFVRLATMHAECIRRVATAESFHIPVDLMGIHNVDTAGCRVLLVGAESAGVDRVSDNLRDQDISVSRESSQFAAGERLAAETFDAAIIVAEAPAEVEKAYFLCAHIRNNSRLFNLPVLLASNSGLVPASDLPYRQGASIAVALDGNPDNLAISLKFLVLRQRLRWNLHAPLTATLTERTADSLRGLYSGSFLRSHMARQLDWTGRRRRSLSLAVFSIQNLDSAESMYGAGAGGQLMQQAANWVSSLIRIEDMAARLAPIEICAVFPDTEEQDARQAADRIAGVLHHSEFTLTGSRNATTRMWTQSGVATSVPGDSVEDLVARARDNLA